MNELKIKGKVIQALDPISGEGKNGSWTKQTFIIETDDEYPKKIAVDVWKNKIHLEVGKECTVYINVESREYNDKWFTNITGWRVENEADPAIEPGHDKDLKAPDGKTNDLLF